MFIIIFLLLLALSITLTILCAKEVFNEDGWVGAVFSWIATASILIALIVGICTISTSNIKKSKIEMYEQENIELEMNVANAIETYIEHEKGIFVEISPKEINTYLVVYPEIEANELIKYQIEILNTNNEQIKTLKNEYLNIGVWKFLVYFGG